MNERDRIQQEAIRNLAKLSASDSNVNGTQWVDPRKEREEHERIAQRHDPNYVATESYDEPPISKTTKKVVIWMRIGLLAYVIYSLYDTFGG